MRGLVGQGGVLKCGRLWVLEGNDVDGVVKGIGREGEDSGSVNNGNEAKSLC